MLGNALVVVVYGYRQVTLGGILSDYIFIKESAYFCGLRDFRQVGFAVFKAVKRLVARICPVFYQQVVYVVYAFSANIGIGCR